MLSTKVMPCNIFISRLLNRPKHSASRPRHKRDCSNKWRRHSYSYFCNISCMAMEHWVQINSLSAMGYMCFVFFANLELSKSHLVQRLVNHHSSLHLLLASKIFVTLEDATGNVHLRHNYCFAFVLFPVFLSWNFNWNFRRQLFLSCNMRMKSVKI